MPTPSDVLIQISQSDPTSLQIKCTFADASGTGTVPASALAELAASETGSLLITTHVHGDVSAGAYAIQLDTYFYADARGQYHDP